MEKQRGIKRRKNEKIKRIRSREGQEDREKEMEVGDGSGLGGGERLKIIRTLRQNCYWHKALIIQDVAAIAAMRKSALSLLQLQYGTFLEQTQQSQCDCAGGNSAREESGKVI